MTKFLKKLLPIFLTLNFVICEENFVTTQSDSYLEALRNSKGFVDNNELAREETYPVYSAPSQNYQLPSYTEHQEFHYPTTSDFDGYPSYTPAPTYGAPAQQYGPPALKYGPPAPQYGPPSYHHSHHHQYMQQQTQGTPYFAPEHWILSKIKAKINLFTLGKILLKLVIFHKIVKFFALICLLLFLPSLKPEEDKEDCDHTGGDYRVLGEKEALGSRLEEINRFVKIAIESFSQQNDTCNRREANMNDTFKCRLYSMVEDVDTQYPYQRIAEMLHHTDRNEIE